MNKKLVALAIAGAVNNSLGHARARGNPSRFTASKNIRSRDVRLLSAFNMCKKTVKEFRSFLLVPG